MMGVRHAQVERLPRPALAFNFDGGRAAKLTVGAAGTYRMSVEVTGLASHAALRPEQGVSAIVAASKGISALHAHGLVGRLRVGDQTVTTNIGMIEGGIAVNVVPDRVIFKAEIRSHDPAARESVFQYFQQVLAEAVSTVGNENGQTAKVMVTNRLVYEQFRLAPDTPCVLAAEAAVRDVNLAPVRAITDGGIDANWMYAHGIPTVSLGAGQVDAHTVNERVDLDQFELACRIALRLATGSSVSDPMFSHHIQESHHA
jgi:tripeptide aminopeptidase